MDTISSVPHEVNSWSGRSCLYSLPFLAQLIHCVTVAYKSSVMCGQKYPCLSVSYICLCPTSPAIGGWCVRFETCDQSVFSTTVWVAPSTVDFWTSIPRLLIEIWYLAVPHEGLPCDSFLRFSVRLQDPPPWAACQVLVLRSLEAGPFYCCGPLLYGRPSRYFPTSL